MQILNIYLHLRIFVLLSLVCVQVDLDLTSGVREREYCSVFVCILYFCNLLKSLLTGKMLICGLLCSYFHLVNSFGCISHIWY